jgi:U3 small nucleolar RNA-associated protein 10
LLSACGEVWAAEKGNGKEKEKGEGDATERMSRINAAVAEKLAGQHTLSLFHPYLHGWWIDDADNILVSDRYSSHFSDLISKSHETDPHVRVLFYLVMRALLSRLSGARALDASAHLLEAINLQRLLELDTEKLTLTEVDSLFPFL